MQTISFSEAKRKKNEFAFNKFFISHKNMFAMTVHSSMKLTLAASTPTIKALDSCRQRSVKSFSTYVQLSLSVSTIFLAIQQQTNL